MTDVLVPTRNHTAGARALGPIRIPCFISRGQWYIQKPAGARADATQPSSGRMHSTVASVQTPPCVESSVKRIRSERDCGVQPDVLGGSLAY